MRCQTHLTWFGKLLTRSKSWSFRSSNWGTRNMTHDNNAVKPVVSLLAAGEQKLKSASLATFNKKVHTQINGHTVKAFHTFGDEDKRAEE